MPGGEGRTNQSTAEQNKLENLEVHTGRTGASKSVFLLLPMTTVSRGAHTPPSMRPQA